MCLGNICRSPTAEGVLRHLITKRGCRRDVEVDSAGTGAWHVGASPDERAAEAARARGIALSGRARQVTFRDFAEFDLLLAMDEENALELRRLAPPGTAHKIRRLADVDVPDPYYGGARGFETVLDLVTDACARLLDELCEA